MPTFDAYAHIGHYVNSNSKERQHCIEIRDKASAAMVTIELSHEQFGFLMSSGEVSVKCDWSGIETLGLKHEYKRVWVASPKREKHSSDGPRTKSENDVLAPLEVDGWRGSTRDIRNHHRWAPNPDNPGEKGYMVGFHRYVDAKTGDPKEISR